MSEAGLPIVVLACNVFQNFLEKFYPPDRVTKTIFLEYGLHRVSRNLKNAIQDQLDQIEHPSLVVLGYGLCGNGLNGIKAGKHLLIIPRTDDCIGILLGSYEAYLNEFNKVPGTYYVSKGWLESGSDPLREYQGYVEKYGEGQARWLMDTQYKHYRRLALVAHNLEDLEKYRPAAREVADFCAQWGMVYEEILGSEVYASRLMEIAAGLDAAAQQSGDDNFIVIPPGGVIRQNQFMRG
jgi:hypothetical protein